MRSLDKQIELFREGIEVAVFNRDDLDYGRVKVVFATMFPVEDLAAKIWVLKEKRSPDTVKIKS